jgi:hypothetical protein
MSVPQSIIDSAKAVESWLEEQNTGLLMWYFPAAEKVTRKWTSGLRKPTAFFVIGVVCHG